MKLLSGNDFIIERVSSFTKLVVTKVVLVPAAVVNIDGDGRKSCRGTLLSG